MVSILLAALAGASPDAGQQAPTASPRATPQAPTRPGDPGVATPSDYVLLTFILRHDQSRTLAELQQTMKDNGFWTAFPPEGIQVESWYAVMGLGQVVTLRVPPARLREVNLAIERTAWKIFRTEVYATYDLREVARANRAQALKDAAK